MESTQSIWHNRRFQRSAGFAFLVLTLIVVALYSRTEWPITTNPLDFKSPSVQATQPSPEEPLYNNAIPEYDPEHMPDIPEPEKPSPSPTFTTQLDATVSTSIAADSTLTNPASVGLHTDRIALIMETRASPLLVAVLSQFIGNLPAAWPVHLVGNQEIFEFVKKSRSLLQYIKSGKLVLIQLPKHYLIDNSEKLSQTLTDITFYADFLSPAEWVLVFQTDSIICSSSEESIDDWVDRGYDWVGAPWNPYSQGGNGGLSLRHIPPIVKALETNARRPNDILFEDIWLCGYLQNLPEPALAMTFSVESVYYERPLGYHLRGSGKLYDGDVWHNRTRMNQIFEYCPETKIIFPNLIIDHPEFPMEDQPKEEEIKAKRGS